MSNMVVRNGWHYYRKTVPEGLRKAVGRREIKETLDTRDPVVAKARWAVVSAKVEEELALLRRRGRAEEFDTSSLTNWEIYSFAGTFYRELVAKNEKDPGDPKLWEQLLSTSDLAVPEKHRTEFERKRTIHSGMNAHPSVRAVRMYGPDLDEFLGRRLRRPDAASRAKLASAVALAVQRGQQQLHRYAQGDHTPDPIAASYPPDMPPALPPVSVDALLDAYISESGARAATDKRWRSIMHRLSDFLAKPNLNHITEDDMVKWKEHRLAAGIAPRTIRDADLAAPRILFKWAIGARKMRHNPVADVKIRVPRHETDREEKGFTESEAEKILTASLKPPSARLTLEGAAARRWLPWLCAYTGARVNEMSSLTGASIQTRSKRGMADVQVIWIAKEFSKTGKARQTAIHPHLIEMGFLDYAKARKDKPLFYDPDRARGAKGPAKQSHKAAQRVADWVRKTVGITDEELLPNHAWRHRFRTMCRTAGLEEARIDLLDGHASTVGQKYGDALPWVMLEWVSRLPRYDVAAP